MGKIDISFQPRLMSAPEAARYLGLSETTLRGLGLPRRELGKRRLYDRYDLEAFANSLRYDAEETDTAGEDSDECDRLFGAGS